ncbi:hypothetical protein [Thalassobacillus sp. CUG 92003]|uniref:hypothetical protein n=1 Tax=Thalassobacillus sp. CUG 92003 TaxID=2736641 RepID=UPI0015E71200|nr:hypothetical protein [Thalassobacillus sp. CUG 92003]
MRDKWLFLITIGAGLLAAVLLWAKLHDTPVIKYFPIDTSQSFQEAETQLRMTAQEDDDQYEIDWNIHSTSDETMYLRQDVSLLFVNGQLKGILNKWKENTDSISHVSTIHGEDSKKYETLTLHHGEIHYPDDNINSIQKMTQQNLYVVDSPHSPLESFSKPETDMQKEWQQTLDHSIQQQLDEQWDQLFTHFNIKKEQYDPVPLTELIRYQDESIPGLNAEETKRVLAQLWEGIYKQYVLGTTDNQSSGHPIQSYIPLILFDKKGDHLIVLFEDDEGNKQKLIQKY